ncbi:cysteine--tRNA ligase [Mycoplasma yeatsii]|uniref:cysteine--tRNA ligase n=1 Tax=Mycoplasma yeatsii TaxID=51365 RepID=UPI0005B24CE0|nr:cysteine--tRNA ligase [Mycoplasma yeatsii]AJM71605.1 cysteinyl-tRNA synthetase [Mycoplasma yeatsii GM274B]
MKIYDSLSKQLKNLDKKEITLYCCGPTVYNFIHIGNARPSILMDVFVRFLRSLNYKVNFLQNVTDVDDKIIAKALEEKTTEKELSERYTKAYLDDLTSLNVNHPDTLIPISLKMNGMIDFIKQLVDNDSAYVVDGDVYFDISKYEQQYSKLSGFKLNELIAGERVEIDSKKKNPLDFTLWKKTDVGVRWESPFGLGRPGWHTECVLLIDEFFNNQTIDIHAGGIDLKFPHHENERIQFIALRNKELANIWMHNGHLQIEDEKMSKSLGNVILVKDFVKEHNANTLRWIFLSSHYRLPLNINKDIIHQANKFLDKLKNLSKKIIDWSVVMNKKVNIVSQSEYVDKFNEYMQDDLNTAMVLSLIESIIKDINKNISSNQEIEILVGSLIHILNTLGFSQDIFNYKINDQDKQLYLQWKEKVQQKDFTSADQLREQLVKKGIL